MRRRLAVGGCVGTLMTMALGLVLPLGAQSESDGHFDEITCKKVVVVDEFGDEVIKLTTSEAMSGVIHVNSSIPGKRGVRIGGGIMGGSIEVYGGGFDSKNKEGVKVEMSGGAGGGSGYVSVYQFNGNTGVLVSVDEYGGQVGVFGDGNSKTRAVMGVNEYGNGAIGTWDKNGYRFATLRGNE